MNTYSDGTSITAPFWVVKCTNCTYKNWSVLKHDKCPECGAPATCAPANEEKNIPA
jgi:hypothetical protein